MKRIACLLLTAAALCVLLSGCDLWMDGSYYSMQPHKEEYFAAVPENMEAKSYDELRQDLMDLVESGSQSGVIYMPDFSPELIGVYGEDAIEYVMTQHPLGAYAVESITCQVGAYTGINAVAVEISYIHGRSEILRIKRAQTMTEAISLVEDSLGKCEAGVVFRVEEFTEADLTQEIQDYVDANPDICMEMPQVTVNLYPEEGQERIVELTYTYQTSRETLRTMQSTVEPVFASAELYVSGDARPREKYAQLYSFLMERYDYTVETSITPSYSLLRHGVGDSKAFATVYAAMCRRAGLECYAISGTRAGEARYWNVILEDGKYYHIDLLQCSQIGKFTLTDPSKMTGYVWDYEAYLETADHEE